MPLPNDWVDALFARLAVRYGAAWLRQWEGVDIKAVKADWADVLGGVTSGGLKHALECLPADKPPTVGQFAALCRNAPQYAPPALPAPALSAQRKAELSAKLTALRNKLTGVSA